MRPVAALTLTLCAAPLAAQTPRTPQQWVPPLDSIRIVATSELRDVVARYTVDEQAMSRRWRTAFSSARRTALDGFYAAWRARLDAMRFDDLSAEGRIDWILLKNRLDHERAELAREGRLMTELAPLLPFAGTVTDLDERLRRFDTVVPRTAARALDSLAALIARTDRAVLAGTGRDTAGAIKATRIQAYRAAVVTTSLREALRHWFRFYDGYDPMFSWWARAPYQRADSSLGSYIRTLREKVVGWKPGDDEPIVGLPIGRQAVLEDLAYEMIPYTPEELIAIARREFTWLESEMKKAARDMGLGDDWRAALERVKEDHVEPGDQPRLVRDLAREAIAYLKQHDLVTIPPLAEDVWRMEMMTPERQKESPFFLGGEVILVSYPTNTMDEDDKAMSMRGNNRHFARATVFHELIPGHHLQGFMGDRYNPHRDAFGTPFWHEGNAFYWETLFWDMGFPQSPENRIGMLWWRMHRAARIIFSLSFHLGEMTPEQAVDFLVERVGHERANATAEVRRSFNGNYSPLYQVAYMMGGVQFRALHHELVDSGTMTNRAFHDAILQGGRMPVEMVRARLTGERLPRDFRTRWRFADSAR